MPNFRQNTNPGRKTDMTFSMGGLHWHVTYSVRGAGDEAGVLIWGLYIIGISVITS